MTAYELADELQELDAKLHLIVLFKSAEMLRQQADRIAELEKILEQEGICVGSDLLNGGIAIVKKIQTKPLSNDEILEMTIWNKNLYELYVEMDKEDMIAFARAIEERHGIK